MAPEAFNTLIEHIEAGHTLKASIRAANTSWRALSLHIERDQEAASRYVRARVTSSDFYADKAQEAVEQAVTKDDAALARVRSEVYRWRAKVANPAVYGDRVDVTSMGEKLQAAVVVMPPEAIPEAVWEEANHSNPISLPSDTSRST